MRPLIGGCTRIVTCRAALSHNAGVCAPDTETNAPARRLIGGLAGLARRVGNHHPTFSGVPDRQAYHPPGMPRAPVLRSALRCGMVLRRRHQPRRPPFTGKLPDCLVNRHPRHFPSMALRAHAPSPRSAPPGCRETANRGLLPEFADDPQRHFLAERSTAFDIVPPAAIDTKKVGKRLLGPAPLKPIAFKRRARFDLSLPGKLQSTTSFPR
jgi:hypothetical protein